MIEFVELNETHPTLADFTGATALCLFITVAFTCIFTVIHTFILMKFDEFSFFILWLSSLSVCITTFALMAAIHLSDISFLRYKQLWAELFWTRVYFPVVNMGEIEDILGNDGDYVCDRHNFWFKRRNDAIRAKMCAGAREMPYA